MAIPFATLPNEPVLRRKLEVQQEEIREELDALAIGVQPDYRLADFLAPPIEYEGVPLDIWQKTNKQLRLPKESIERIFDFKDEILASLAKGVRVSGSRIDCFVVTHENVAELLIASFMSDFDPMSATVDDLNHLAHLSRGEGITVWLNKYGKVLEKERIKPSSFYATDVV